MRDKLHWLPVDDRTVFKIIIMGKALIVDACRTHTASESNAFLVPAAQSTIIAFSTSWDLDGLMLLRDDVDTLCFLLGHWTILQEQYTIKDTYYLSQTAEEIFSSHR